MPKIPGLNPTSAVTVFLGGLLDHEVSYVAYQADVKKISSSFLEKWQLQNGNQSSQWRITF